MESPSGLEPVDVKVPKNTKENRYYYRHREEINARRKEQRMATPEYKAKQEEKERKRKEKEEEMERKKQEKEKEKEAKRLAKMNALLPKTPRCE